MAPRPRSELQELLEGLLGSEFVYYQPPESIAMEYPCIVYTLDDVETDHANNAPYNHRKRYQITVMDRNPDSEIPWKVAMLPTAAFDRRYTADQLNHDVYRIFF